MDKYEYKVRSEEISNLIDKEKYTEAVNIADTIDWRRVKSAAMLLKIAALYRVNRRNEDSREILMLAYERYPTNRSVVYSLCELSIELDDVVAAIEYYKQFVKLAPKDNGVYTLRYRILEAQEASLEERIEILEELKKRDYQEEWAYELAYLYHRVGLATKCVEECDDIILWFGDGPYVMKAMELKALHVPLTEIQQAKYDAMLNHAEENYNSEEVYPENGYEPEAYGEQSYENGGYEPEAYGEQPYENGGYEPEAYGEQPYENGGYEPEAYGEQSYENGGYEPEAYGEQPYENDGYSQDGYVDDGYGNLSYVGGSYQDNSSTGEFYVEQTFDENGNPIEPESYPEEAVPEENDINHVSAEADALDESYSSSAYHEPSHSAQEYNQGAYVQENRPAANNAGDMSQYNTINLQKVVAESMKELFPDDDVFAEDREKYNSGEMESITGNTLVSKANISDHEAETAEEITDISESGSSDSSAAAEHEENTEKTVKSETPSLSEEAGSAPEADIEEKAYAKTNRIAELTTGVSESAPEPHTGAISKVIIPGNDARFIKADSDMDKLRDITEQEVNEEQSRIESNAENVYHDQPLGDIKEEAMQKQAAGSMSLNDVLQKWERMKLDNARKHQEEIKRHVLTQTGRMFENFDNSIKSGILGELEREEPPKEAVTKEGFLEADITEDIPQHQLKQISDDDQTKPSEMEERFEMEEPSGGEELSDVEAFDDDEDFSDAGTFADPEQFSEFQENTQTVQYAEEEAYADAVYDDTRQISPEPDMAYYDEAYDTAPMYDEEPFDEEEAFEGDTYEEEIQHSEIEEDDALDPEEEESIAEMAMEDALKTQEIKMNTADLSSLSEKIVATTKKEAKGAKREEIRDFTPEEQALFENFAVTKKIKKQIIYALDNMTLTAYTGNVIITGDVGLDTVRMAKNLVKEYQAADAGFSGKAAKITGEKINQRNLKDIFEKLNNGGIIIEKANGMSEEKLYEMASLLNQENLGIIVIMEDTKKEITKLLQKQAMIADYFNIRIDLMEMDNNALVAYAKNYALALEYSIDELGTLALYTRIANMQSGNHVVTKDEVRDIIDEAIWKSKKSKIKNFVDVLFARRYDNEDMIVLKERDFI
ncbi:MAG: hypothetical protein J6D08_02125 [Lachnospiraceae bacterium]|nr:hypothetical protein [Lachnospiraceae bacterium]